MINIKSGNILNCTENIIIHQEIWKDIKGYELKKAHNYIWKYEEDINDKNKKTAIF